MVSRTSTSCLIACFVFLTAHLSIRAQSVNFDSLWSIWSDPANADTVRLKAMQRIAWEGYLFSDPDSAYHFAQLEYDLAAERGLKRHMAVALNVQAVSFHVRGDLSQALDHYQRSQALFEEAGGLAGAAAVLNNIGNIHYDRGDLPRALDAYIKSLDFAVRSGDPDIGDMLQNIALVHYDMKEYDQALEYDDQSIRAHLEHGREASAAEVIGNRGLVHQQMGQLDKAIIDHEEGLSIMERLGNRSGIASALHNLGSVYADLGDEDRAMDHYQRSLVLKKELEDQAGIISSTTNIGNLFRKQGRYKEAIQWCTEALRLAEEVGVMEHEMACNECLYAAHKVAGDFAQALRYRERAETLRDSLFNNENTKKITRLGMQYEFDKKEAATRAAQEKKDAVAAEELRRQKVVRNGFMGGFALVALFAGVFLSQRNRIGKEKKRSEELLLNILPEEVADELKEKGEAEAKLIDQVTVLFTDFKGFTAMSEKLSPKELVKDLHECFSAFDRICEEHGLEKIKTIGDAYMAAGGLPTPNTTHASDVIKAALAMRDFIAEGKERKINAGLPYFEIRIGVHTGPVVAGIVGVKKFQYD
ncbi:MAG: tetratricopeptide repeat protein, partial [Flavobacteriales bacterium]|nr:tetratricopeptide repeat protein [Flavobacteriales bacterium]